MSIKQDLSDSAYKVLQNHEKATRLQVQPSTLVVSMRISELFSLRIECMIKPISRYRIRIRRLGSNHEEWSKQHYQRLSGIYTPSNEGHDACVTVLANDIQGILNIINKLSVGQ